MRRSFLERNGLPSYAAREMAEDHIVRQGECLSSIARQFGFKDSLVLHNDTANAELKALRPNPNLLMPGDLVAIPEPRGIEGTYATGNWHELKVELEPARLKLRLQNFGGVALAHQDYQLTVDGKPREGTTDGAGLVDELVPPDAKTAELKTKITRGDEEQELTLRLVLRSLDPISEVSGLQGRLANLQLYGGAIDGDMGQRTRGALAELQRSAGLDPTGIPDSATVKALEDLHDRDT